MTLQALLPLITYPDVGIGLTEVLAAQAAHHIGADLHALVLGPDFRASTNRLARLVGDVPSLPQGANDDSRERGRAAYSALEHAARECEVACRVGRVEAIPELFGDVVARHGRYHDIVMIGWARGDEALRGVIEATVFGSGRPVLLLPERRDPPSFGTVVIAWDGSRVAARAVADAHLFLAKAKRIVVTTVTDEKQVDEPQIAERLVEYFSLRGLPAEPRGLAGLGRPIAQTLQNEVLATGAGLLVMGGYGHSRLRDFILGGATKGLLDDLQVPVLMSH